MYECFNYADFQVRCSKKNMLFWYKYVQTMYCVVQSVVIYFYSISSLQWSTAKSEWHTHTHRHTQYTLTRYKKQLRHTSTYLDTDWLNVTHLRIPGFWLAETGGWAVTPPPRLEGQGSRPECIYVLTHRITCLGAFNKLCLFFCGLFFAISPPPYLFIKRDCCCNLKNNNSVV